MCYYSQTDNSCWHCGGNCGWSTFSICEIQLILATKYTPSPLVYCPLPLPCGVYLLSSHSRFNACTVSYDGWSVSSWCAFNILTKCFLRKCQINEPKVKWLRRMWVVWLCVCAWLWCVYRKVSELEVASTAKAV